MSPPNMERERFEDLASLHVLGALEGAELQEFEAALAEAGPEEAALYRELRQVVLHLAVGVEPASPSDAVRTRILTAVGGAAGATGAERTGLLERLATALGFGNPAYALSVASVLLAVSLSLLYYAFQLREFVRREQEQVTALRSELQQTHERFAALRDELTKKTELLAVLQSPTIDVVIMKGLEVNPAGYGKIIWDPDKRRAILQISNLPAVPEGKDYQLWVIKGNAPISAGVFAVTDPSAENLFKIEQLVETDRKSIGAFAVTLEPKGGVPQPTGAMYLLGSPAN